MQDNFLSRDACHLFEQRSLAAHDKKRVRPKENVHSLCGLDCRFDAFYEQDRFIDTSMIRLIARQIDSLLLA